ncbi:MAG TPA: hypothetical protein QF624_05665 [Dehalococcoidia bacterium]|nr:hypothetical protein [Dehalococcoidia bacterium]
MALLAMAIVGADACDGSPAPDSVSPPAVVASGSDGSEVQLGLGSYCWRSAEEQFALCADSIGRITNVDPLVVAVRETVALDSPLLTDVEIALHAWSVESDQPIESAPDWLAWSPSGDPMSLAASIGGGSVAFDADLTPGLYVVSAMVIAPPGDVLYGLLLRVEGD